MNKDQFDRRRKRAGHQKKLELFATCPRKASPVLAEELRSLGIQEVSEAAAGVRFSADLKTAYRVLLWSRVASRLLLTLHKFPAPDPDSLYRGVQGVDWTSHLDLQKTLAVDFTATRSSITHTKFGALKVKDAVVDQLREARGTRPFIKTDEPDLRVNVHVHNDEAILSIDLSGDSLHKRGYRLEGGAAPLRENLAAAILLRSRWPEIAKKGGPLVDPMCGSGTLLIEGAMIAGNIAPGLNRTYYGFMGWKGHDRSLWSATVGDARKAAATGKGKIPPIKGSDIHPRAVEFARSNAARAGLGGYIKIECREMAKARPPMRSRGKRGLVAVNPPYGERMGNPEELAALYQQLGTTLKKRFLGYEAAVFTGEPGLVDSIGLGQGKSSIFFNGPIECKLFRYTVLR